MAPPSEAAKRAFTSAHLLYRALDFPADERYLLEHQCDYLGQAQATPALLMPGSREGLEELKKYLGLTLLAVMICLRPSSSSSSSSSLEGAGMLGKEAVPIGIIHLNGSSARLAHHRRSMIGVRIHEEYRSKGYGTEAIEWILNWGFQFAGLHRIGINASGWNQGAIRLYERMGFVREGLTRECLWFDGAWYDLHMLGMLEHEWRAKQESGREPGNKTTDNLLE